MKICDGREAFVQWDANVRITDDLFKVGDEIHFGNCTYDCALTVKAYQCGDKVVADVPNILLTKVYPIRAFLYIATEDGDYTITESTFAVKPRPKPADYVYTETECVKVKDFVFKALEEAKKNGDFKGDPGADGKDGKDADVSLLVPRMSVIDEEDGNNAVENYKGEGVKFSDAYNRVYVELSKGRGVSARYCLTAGTNVPLDPDPEDFANGKKLDSIPLRMDDGFIRVPVSEYGKTQPEIGDDNYSEDERAMSKKYIDSAVESRVKKAFNSSDLNQLYGELSKSRGQTMYPLCNGPTAASDHIPQRTRDGLMRCNTPDDGADNICANKGYVDKFATELLAGLDSIIAKQNELLGG